MPVKVSISAARYLFAGKVIINGEHRMCDYSLHAIASRPARVGERLVTTGFHGSPTRGFAAKEERAVAICLAPGTELAFDQEVKYNRSYLFTRDDREIIRSAGFCVALFCKIEPRSPDLHRDALLFPDGTTVLVNKLSEGQCARVLQLPVNRQEKNVDIRAERDPASEADSLVWA
jgi:hypothetical protein